MYIEEKLGKYLDDLAAKKPAPGGGSAAALTGALGAALLGMVTNFTIGKEQYRKSETDMKNVLAHAEKLRADFSGLVDEDVAAYDKVAYAYQLPKNTEEEKKLRTMAVQHALQVALQVPMAVCRTCRETMRICPVLLELGNVNLVSDVGVAAELLTAAFRSAALNVEINLAGIKDAEFIAGVREELTPLEAEIDGLREKIVAGARKKITCT